ncbi:hypothetical protein HK097_009767 [Rhizophlyctis rosea]|uniref:Uncharacterized protein n=1 Tax=Rhizophlyctis rosea TaxID=64517 RepID=A0AAD5S8F6_9FUNG|nr:hypothetical protein HK097_009767 [Rhizophlyctis rosea]
MTETQTIGSLTDAFDAPDWSDEKWAESARKDHPQPVTDLWVTQLGIPLKGKRLGQANDVTYDIGTQVEGAGIVPKATTVVHRATGKVRDTAELGAHVAGSVVNTVTSYTLTTADYIYRFTTTVLNLTVRSTKFVLTTALDLTKEIFHNIFNVVIYAVLIVVGTFTAATRVMLHIVGIDFEPGQASWPADFRR